MRKLLLTCLTVSLTAFAVPSHAKDDAATSQHRKETIAQHQAIAEAHTAAAECLRSGKDEKTCHEELAAACKGLALGKRCGMRHAH
ncbi:hypothetical protein [uncultured Oxalicibacterium sp.]|uniref:hypothetical protein n=1 Tax=uncultured Oxalicibacterium sp. TaxID=1168540 RepID=UPI0025E623E4|nr:hypothetical protein [uncultured Oxalicibacterium sp.]